MISIRTLSKLAQLRHEGAMLVRILQISLVSNKSQCLPCPCWVK
jgi:hypothetical protein